MAEALTVHSSNIAEWADERGLAISAPKSTITLFFPQFAQSNECRTKAPRPKAPGHIFFILLLTLYS